MNVFEAVRNSVTARQAAEYYGIQVRHNGMACCPFHSDKTPSMKLDRRYHCFGCGADGDAIDFTAAYFKTDKTSAAKKLASDFGISYENKWNTQKSRPIEYYSGRHNLTYDQEYKVTENRCFRAYLDYYHLLEHWKQTRAPTAFEEEYDDLYVEACHELDYVRYVLDDIFISGTYEERAEFVREHKKKVSDLEKRISEFTHRTAKSDASEYYDDGVNADQ